MNEPEHNITGFEIEMIHRDKDGKVKGVYHEELPITKHREVLNGNYL